MALFSVSVNTSFCEELGTVLTDYRELALHVDKTTLTRRKPRRCKGRNQSVKHLIHGHIKSRCLITRLWNGDLFTQFGTNRYQPVPPASESLESAERTGLTEGLEEVRHVFVRGSRTFMRVLRNNDSEIVALQFAALVTRQ